VEPRIGGNELVRNQDFGNFSFTMNVSAEKVNWGAYQSAAFLLGMLALVSFGTPANERDEWREKMQSIVPHGYLCRYTTNAIQIDGNPDDTAWNLASWTTDFGDIVGPSKPAPRFRTRAKMLWDDNYLYICAELEEPHVWATLTNHDSVIFRDPDFEVFIDPKGSTHNYYEFEMNALNTSWDLRLDKPYLDHGKPHNEWDIPGLKTAVRVHGTINDPSDTDRGWTTEIAFPWRVLETYARHPGAPNEGEQWRINFSRVEWQISVTNGVYQKKPGLPEDNWVWSPIGVVDMHRPEMWGLLQFTRGQNSDTASVVPIAGKTARDTVLEVYHAQRDFWNMHTRWATNLIELGWPMNESAAIGLPQLLPTPDGYVCSSAFQDSSGEHTWRVRQDRLLALDEELPVESETFVAHAGKLHGDKGRRAAWFLIDNMPMSDRSVLSEEFLMTNLDLALKARTNFPWARAISEPMFLNDVLPYASLDEPRDEWRTDFYKLAGEIVRDCKTAGEAAQVLNRDLFKRVNVHYNTGRKRNNQSPAESIEQGKATCTGLAIILVDACRAVGVPARVVGVPQWAQKEGNHTWAEYWDGDWHFLGADEYDKAGPDRAWFNNDAAITVATGTNSINQIYASSWRRTGTYFPLAWDFESREVPGINVSYRYANLAPSTNSAFKVVYVRLRERAGGERVSAKVELRSASDVLLSTNQTRAGTADLNDMPKFELPNETVSVYLRFIRGAEIREKVIPCAACARSQTFDLVWDELTPASTNLLAAEAWLERLAAERGNPPDIQLSRSESKRIAGFAWERLTREEAQAMRDELSAEKITIGNDSLRWMEKTFGDAPFGKRSLWITMHGGGQGTAEENDRNWRGYYGRYEFPPGSINVAPRAPANTWNMWFVKPVDDLFDRLIADMVAQRGVDPNRVYLIGYSAGGDGVYQLSPRLADRFAAATMCAGHPNQITPEGLRNLPFFLYMGGEDSAYHRNTVVREFNAKLDALQASDPAGYVHRCTVYAGLMHDMQGREAETIPRMSALHREVWPRRVVWKQDANVTHDRFYWMERPGELVKPNEIFAAHVTGQTIEIEQPASGSLTLRLSDELLDLDEPIQIVASGRIIFNGKASRSLAAIMKSLKERPDPESVASALMPVSW
jgi:transglutaminase-like putative cysteine protease/predicted esterase